MSSYLVLARKYRPKTFAEVVGQEVVTRVLAGALEAGRIGHAYLFSGPRGTGKTTIARIFAKCLNCESGPTPRPCGRCARCRAADEGSEVDTIELDAASHTGVDTIRELRDEAIYAPMRARYKVYIVDEVHMLSKGAFNALLKTLEEPPPHVVFLFATTEQHKVLDTILSRCQVLRLEPLPSEEIAARLTLVLEREAVRAGPGVVEELAREARGGMRDALSLADKLLALAGTEPTLEDVLRLGGGGQREVEGLLDRLEAGDRGEILRALSSASASDGELVTSLLDELRRCVVLAYCGRDTPLVSGAPAERAAALARAERLGPERVELWLQELLRARERMRLFAGQERLVLEVALLDLARSETTMPVAELVARLEALEAGAEPPSQAAGRATLQPAPARPRPAGGASPGSAPAPAAASPAPLARAAADPDAESRRAAPAPASGEEELWARFLSELGASHEALAQTLGRVGRLSGQGERFQIRCQRLTPAEERMALDRRNQAAVTRALSRAAGRDVGVSIELGEGQAPGADGSEAPTARRPARSDEFTQQVADLFGGVIEDLS